MVQGRELPKFKFNSYNKRNVHEDGIMLKYFSIVASNETLVINIVKALNNDQKNIAKIGLKKLVMEQYTILS